MTPTYTVIDPTTGEALETGVTAASAAHTILTDDGREYDIRAADDGEGFELWSRQQVANKGWTRTVVFSILADREAAEADIFERVINAGWARHPEAMTDEVYAEMQRQLAEEL